jgi:hypothetical protein
MSEPRVAQLVERKTLGSAGISGSLVRFRSRGTFDKALLFGEVTVQSQCSHSHLKNMEINLMVLSV